MVSRSTSATSFITERRRNPGIRMDLAYLMFSMKLEDSLSSPITDRTPSNYIPTVGFLNDRPLLSHALQVLSEHAQQDKKSNSCLVQFLEEEREERNVQNAWALLKRCYVDVCVLSRISNHTTERFRATYPTTAIRLGQIEAIKTLVEVGPQH